MRRRQRWPRVPSGSTIEGGRSRPAPASGRRGWHDRRGPGPSRQRRGLAQPARAASVRRVPGLFRGPARVGSRVRRRRGPRERVPRAARRLRRPVASWRRSPPLAFEPARLVWLLVLARRRAVARRARAPGRRGVPGSGCVLRGRLHAARCCRGSRSSAATPGSGSRVLEAAVLRPAGRRPGPGAPAAAVAAVDGRLPGSASRCCAASVPWGGFPWGRLAFATVDTPLAAALAWVGAAGTTFLSRCSADRWPGSLRRRAPARSAPRRWPRPPSWRWSLARAAARRRRRPGRRPPGSPRSRATCRARGWTPSPSAGPCSTTTSRPPSTSRPRSSAGRAPQPDFVLWPENSTDIDPFERPDRLRRHRRRGRRGRRADRWSARWSTARARTTCATRASSGTRAPARGEQLRQAAPGAVRRVHPVPRAARAVLRAARPDPARHGPRHRAGRRSSSPARRSATSSASRSPTTAWCATSSTAAPSCSSCRPTTPPTWAPARSSSSSRSRGCGRSRPAATSWSRRPTASPASSRPTARWCSVPGPRDPASSSSEVAPAHGVTPAVRLGAVGRAGCSCGARGRVAVAVVEPRCRSAAQRPARPPARDAAAPGPVSDRTAHR